MRALTDRRVIEAIFLTIIVAAISISLIATEDITSKTRITGEAVHENWWQQLRLCLKEKTVFECLFGEEDYFIKPNKKHWVDKLEKLKQRCLSENNRIICRALNKKSEDKIYAINESYNPPPGSILLEAEEMDYWLLNETRCFKGICNISLTVKPKIPDFCLNKNNIIIESELASNINIEGPKKECYEEAKEYNIRFNIPPGSKGKFDITISYEGSNYTIDPYFEDMSNESCYVSQTCGPGFNALFSISNQSNAHAAVNPNHYTWKVCCNETVNAQQEGNYTIAIRLKNTSNSHAQLNNYSTYTNPIYVGTNNTEDNVTCINSDSCPPDYFCVISLKNQTNSHVGECSAYTNKVCCKATLKLTDGCADTDNDGECDTIDKLYWNESNVTIIGASNLNITLDGNGTIYGVAVNQTRTVEWFDNGDKFLNFTYNFAEDILDLSNVTITKVIDLGTGSKLDGINMSQQLQGINNTLIFEELEGVQWLCIRQNDTQNISQISESCTGQYEYDFSTCITNPTTINNIYCYHDDPNNKFYVTGQNALGALQNSNPYGPGGPEIPEFSTIGKIAAISIVIGTILLRRKLMNKKEKKKRKNKQR